MGKCTSLEVSGSRAPATLNLMIMLASVAGLVLIVALWPLSALLRRTDRATSTLAPKVTGLRRRLRLAALVGLAFVAGWYVVLRPVLSSQLDFYSAALDPVLIALNVFGLVVVAVAVAAAWWSYRLLRIRAPWSQSVGAVVTTTALVGVVWIGLQGGLMSFTLNY